MKLIYPDLVKKTSDIYLNDHGLTPWIYHLSRGGLMVPSNYFLKDWEVFDQKFKEFHLPLLDRHPKVIERFCQVLEDSFGDKYDKAILNLFAKTRTMIRIRYLNAQLEFNTGGSEKIRGKKQIGQFQV
uniref:Putative LOC100569726 [Acyrthosiphon pisum] n=1 Tax=Lepeophtheirus salmonis TaxID=72036 RepID=A0A0K2T465_LEPSM